MTLTPADISTVVEVDFSGTDYAGSPTWTDVSSAAIVGSATPNSAPISISWGLQEWFSQVNPSQATYTLFDADGTFTPGNTDSSYYPNVRRRARTHISTTIDSTTVDLFDGYWDWIEATGRTPDPWTSDVQATDILGRVAADVPLRGFLAEEMLVDSPLCLYGLQEDEGSLSFADLTANFDPGTKTDSPVGEGVVDAGQDPAAFSAAPVAATLNGTIVGVSNALYPSKVLTAVSGSYLAFPATPTVTTDFTFECWIQFPPIIPPTIGDSAWVAGSFTSTAGWFLTIVQDGFLQFTLVDATLGPAGQITTAASVCDGLLHHVVCTVSGGSAMEIWMDDVSVQTGTAARTISTLTTGVPVMCGLNSVDNDQPFTGGYAYLALYDTVLDSTRIDAHYTAGTTAFAGESISDNATRLMSYRPNLGFTADTSIGDVGPGDCYGATLADQLQLLATSDGGVVFADGNGVLNLRNRDRYSSPSPAVTLDCAAGDVNVGSVFRSDIQNVTNDVTVTRPGGADQRQFDAGSITADGESQQTVDSNLNTDAQAAALATYLLGIGTTEKVVMPPLAVNLYTVSSSAQALAVLALEPMDVLEIVNLPAQAPASTMDFTVLGGSMSISSENFDVTLYVVPVPSL